MFPLFISFLSKGRIIDNEMNFKMDLLMQEAFSFDKVFFFLLADMQYQMSPWHLMAYVWNDIKSYINMNSM